ncbi:MAG: ankyrin repeat domain-containing protein [Bdellovibrionales bacterium]|nr:ankyrin repeat domain-containing protein [Bdellovibrionales bacterium]
MHYTSPELYEQISLDYVSQSGRIKILKLLLKSGADVNVRDIYGQTPLYYVH